MAHLSAAVASIRKQIQRLEANIDELKKDIRAVEALEEPSAAKQKNLERWAKKLDKYEVELKEACAKELQALGFQAQAAAPVLLPPAASVPTTELKNVLDTIEKDDCVKNKTAAPKVRDNLGPTLPADVEQCLEAFTVPTPPPDLERNLNGFTFHFVNRVEECKIMLSVFYNMERWRGKSFHKRDLRVPYTIGLSGVGKSRFARECVHHLAWELAVDAGKVNPSLDDLVATADMLVTYLVVEDPVSDIKVALTDAEKPNARRFVEELIRATYNQRNLCVDCRNLSELSEVGAYLLMQWLKPRLKPGVTPKNIFDKLLAVKPTVHQAINAILGSTDCAVIINIDEADSRQAETLLPQILDLLVYALRSGQRVYFNVTGVKSLPIIKGLEASSAAGVLIVLSLLEQKHMVDIIDHMLTEPGQQRLFHDGVPAMLSYALFYLGGVPLNLLYFLSLIQKLLKTQVLLDHPPSTLRDALLTADLRVFMSALNYVSRKVIVDRNQLLDKSFELAVYSKLFSLAVGEVIVPSSLPLIDGKFDLLDAQTCGLVYLEPAPTGTPSAQPHPSKVFVRATPLFLREVQLSEPSPQAVVHPLAAPSTSLSPTATETLAVSVILHKLRAAHLAGKERVCLSELGLQPVRAVGDIEVTVPSSFDLVPLNTRVTADNFAEFSTSMLSKYGGVRAFLNGPQAPFADAFIVFAEVVVFIQEKQSVEVRRRYLEGKSNVEDLSALIKVEYYKLLPSTKKGKKGPKKFVFVFITDEEHEGSLLPVVAERTWVCDRRQHSRLLGTMVAVLRAYAVAEEDARANNGKALEALTAKTEYASPLMPFVPSVATAAAAVHGTLPAAGVAAGLAVPAPAVAPSAQQMVAKQGPRRSVRARPGPALAAAAPATPPRMRKRYPYCSTGPRRSVRARPEPALAAAALATPPRKRKASFDGSPA
eukprot:m.82778 g.82778  ORF g.82778 m.82778 type:complete len:935 (-) comp8136_c0_seq1:1199-4003(-)